MDDNAWVVEKLDDLETPEDEDDLEEKNLLPKFRDLEFLDTELPHFNNNAISANITIHPLIAEKDNEEIKVGSMVMIENISDEKRMKSTMSRYMNPKFESLLNSYWMAAKNFWAVFPNKALAPSYSRMSVALQPLQ